MLARISGRGRYAVGVAVVGLLLGTAQLAQAQNTRSWVSGVGDDVNPCSRTAPCKTFAGAISKTLAGGTIDCLDPGGFGAVTITKSLTIEGGLWNASVLVQGTSGIVVSANPGDVVILRNLAIESVVSNTNGGIHGIRFIAGGELHVEHVTITNFVDNGIDFEPSNAGAKLFVDNTSVRNNGTSNATGGGVYVLNGEATIDHLTADGNFYGIRVGAGGTVTVSNSVVSGGSEGFLAANDPSAVLNISSSTTTHNDFGIVASQGATVRCNAVTIVNNHSYGLFNDGASTLVSFGNNALVGNSINGVFSVGVAVQ